MDDEGYLRWMHWTGASRWERRVLRVWWFIRFRATLRRPK